MEEATKDINRIKVVLVEKKRTNKWLAEQLGKDPATVSKWCTNTSQPGLETLLQSLLEISKLETGLIQLDQKTLPIMDTIISAVNRTYPKAAEKGIELIFDCNESLEHCALTQDKRWLGEAIINVLDNAIKYSPEHSKITIRLQKRTGFVRIEIEDQGIGIPQSEYHKIFQRFYRGTAPEVREKSGTGIGLYLSRQIIEQHGGTITVASGKVRKGSTFLIQLPENGLS